MKGTPSDMLDELAGPSRLAICYKLVPRLGDPLTVTAHDAPLLDPVDGLTYVPIPGGGQSDVATDISATADNLNVEGAAVAPYPTMDSVRAGDWDYARALVFYLCWADPTKGRHILRSGRIGEVSTGISSFNMEIRGLVQVLTTSIVNLTQPGCRHRFGDDLCNLDGNTDPENWKIEGVVEYVDLDGNGNTVIHSSSLVEGGSSSAPAQAGGNFAHGYIRMEDGDNAGRIADIKRSMDGEVVLELPFPYAVEIGESFTAYYGCDGLRETCVNRFDNIHNMDAEPFMPGTDKLIRVARR